MQNTKKKNSASMDPFFIEETVAVPDLIYIMLKVTLKQRPITLPVLRRFHYVNISNITFLGRNVKYKMLKETYAVCEKTVQNSKNREKERNRENKRV